MKNNIYRDNIDYLFHTSTNVANYFYIRIKENTNNHIETFIVDLESSKGYYIQQLNEIKDLILTKTQDNFNIKDLIKITFEDNKVKIDRDSFNNVAKKFLKVSNDFLIVDEFEKQTDWEKILKKKTSINQMMNDVGSLFDNVSIINIEQILFLSISLKYFKTQLNENKDLVDFKMNIKGVPKFDLLQRYNVLDKTLDITSEILKLDTSMYNKQKLLAVLLNCSIDNAKHLINGTYESKLIYNTNREDEVNNFINTLNLNT